MLGALFAQLHHVTFDTPTEGFFHEDDPLVATYNAFRDQFGRDGLVVLALHPVDVVAEGFLRKLQAFHEVLQEEIPQVKEVTSLIDARLTQGKGDRLIVGELLEDWPATPADWARLRAWILGNPLYRDLVISADARFTTVVVETNNFSAEGEEDNLLGGFGGKAPRGRRRPGGRC